MSDTVIKVENISKQYRLGEIGTGSISHDVNRWWNRVRGKEDLYLKIGETNDRTAKGNSEYVWALRDINFEVKQGEVLGIIGRNGAGKSTLLKILSRTTLPTTGSVKIKGRVASLLEVGTGFHPDLSGRENIFLNGAILGMTRQEIKNRFDEIVDFAGVERYIETPVKRYSSGMYVRLAFAVAAHLEPEILIVDEVLAVGDIEFQKRCLGKMKDVSVKDGRTVLFVSHNMAAITSLCTTGIVMRNGMLIQNGGIQDSVNYYLRDFSQNDFRYHALAKKGDDKIEKIELLFPKEGRTSFLFEDEIPILFSVYHFAKIEGTHLGVAILDKWSKKIFTDTFKFTPEQLKNNISKIKISIPSKLLLSGTYHVDAALFVPNMNSFDYVSEACSFEIEDFQSTLSIYGNADIGNVFVECKWEIL